VIRQAITCDICASEKKQTNHWFVAYEQAGELRVSGWSTRNRLRPGTKHLCGQICLHKLVDDFMARSVEARIQAAANGDSSPEPHATDTSLTANAVFEEFESSARLVTPPSPQARPGVQSGIVAIAASQTPERSAPPPVELPRYASRAWRAEAWERERERESRAAAHHPEIGRRRSGTH